MRSWAYISILMALVVFTASAQAGTWSHARLKSEENVQITIDSITNYIKDSSYKPTNIYTAEPVYVNVAGASLRGRERVRAVVSNYEVHIDEFGEHLYPEGIYTLDLAWQGDHYSGELRRSNVERNDLKIVYRPMTIRREGYAGITNFRQEISVVVDGNWLKDPISRSHNFQLDLYALHSTTTVTGKGVRLIDQIADDITVVQAATTREITTENGYEPSSCIAGDCTREHERRTKIPTLHRITNVSNGNFFCHVLDVVTVSETKAFQLAEGIGFFYRGWNEAGVFVPKEKLVLAGKVRLKNGKQGLLHRFTGLANCWMGSSTASTRAQYSFKPYLQFRAKDGRTVFRNWDRHSDHAITPAKNRLDRRREVLD